MTPREIIAAEVAEDAVMVLDGFEHADRLLTALSEAGYRIVGKGEMDRETIKRAAEVAEDDDGYLPNWGEHRNAVIAQRTGKDIAAAIRSLLPEEKG